MALPGNDVTPQTLTGMCARRNTKPKGRISHQRGTNFPAQVVLSWREVAFVDPAVTKTPAVLLSSARKEKDEKVLKR